MGMGYKTTVRASVAKGGKLKLWLRESATPKKSGKIFSTVKSVGPMPRRPSTVRTPRRLSSPRIQAQLASQRSWEAYRKAVRTFRPRKTERGQVVMLASKPTRDGKSVRLGTASQRQGFAVYVTPAGKVQPLVEKRGQAPWAHRRMSMPVDKFKSKRAKAAGLKWLAPRVASQRGLDRVWKPGRGKESVNWPTVKGGMKRAMATLAARNRTAQVQVSKSVVVVRFQDEDGDEFFRTFEAKVICKLTDAQAKGPARNWDWDAWEAKSLEHYALIAEQLKGADMVSRGSAYYISNLAVNRGVTDMTDFLDEIGNKWEKNECQIVDFKSWAFSIGRAVIDSD